MSESPPALGTCKFFISPEQPECGKRAEAVVRTRITKNDSATVELCTQHKAVYDEQYARRRKTTSKGRSVSYLTKSSGRTEIEA